MSVPTPLAEEALAYIRDRRTYLQKHGNSRAHDNSELYGHIFMEISRNHLVWTKHQQNVARAALKLLR